MRESQYYYIWSYTPVVDASSMLYSPKAFRLISNQFSQLNTEVEGNANATRKSLTGNASQEDKKNRDSHCLNYK